jgi:FKBP-type peptidyl-prolyl cis-trans isomerase
MFLSPASNFRFHSGFRFSLVWLAYTMISFAFLSCQSGKMKTSKSGLQYVILKKGSGPKAQVGKEILLFETTSYRNGTVLYSNENTTKPVKVLIGGNQATQAVDEGLRGMRVGEIKKIIAPPYLVKRTGYPENVHPDSTLVIKMILHKIL